MANPSLRESFGLALAEAASERDDFVLLDADVAGGTAVTPFREGFPNRFIQCGIAEQNMVSMAAGLSTTGVIPVVAAYGVFLTMRAVEQVRNSIAYPDFNVKLSASHLGLDVGPDGATHQAVEDIAIMRAIPNMVVLAPALKQNNLSAIVDAWSFDSDNMAASVNEAHVNSRNVGYGETLFSESLRNLIC